MLSYAFALVFGALQGLSELFPVSSLGHSVILPAVFGWPVDQHNGNFLLFLVATHLATALVLFAFFWADWIRILHAMVIALREREITAGNHAGRIGWLLVVGTVPAGLLGLLFEERLKAQLAFPNIAAGMLIVNGLMLFAAEHLRRRQKDTHERADDARIARLSWGKTLQIGCFQALALIPGFSRTGATMTAGLVAGLSHADAAHFSFLLAAPIIGAAAVLKMPELLQADARPAVGPILFGMVCAGLGAYLTVRFLTRYFQTKTLTPFAVYCVCAGLLASVILYFS